MLFVLAERDEIITSFIFGVVPISSRAVSGTGDARSFHLDLRQGLSYVKLMDETERKDNYT